MQPKLSNKLVEEFWVLLLNNSNEVIKMCQISQGGLSRTVVDSRLIFKACILHNAIGLVLIHNHPSGNIEPSPADVQLTTHIQHGSKTLELKLVDHLVIGGQDYFSFADNGIL